MTDEQYQKLVRYVKKMKTEHDQSIQDLWDRINEVDNAETALVDDALAIANRARRAVLRLEKRVEELEQVD